MGLLKSFQFHAWNPLGTTAKLVEEWKPKNCRTEKECEKSLAEFLREKLEDIQVIHQAGSGRIRADLEVGGKVMIELKQDLDTTAKLQRLKGQIEDYVNTGKSILIVITGKMDKELERDLRKFVESKSDLPSFDDRISLIIKK